ncbi:SAM domain-containing protein [Pseudoscourfieldia marina]
MQDTNSLASHLHAYGVPPHVAARLVHITTSLAPFVSDEDLISLGIDTIGARRRVMHAFAALAKNTQTTKKGKGAAPASARQTTLHAFQHNAVVCADGVVWEPPQEETALAQTEERGGHDACGDGAHDGGGEPAYLGVGGDDGGDDIQPSPGHMRMRPSRLRTRLAVTSSQEARAERVWGETARGPFDDENSHDDFETAALLESLADEDELGPPTQPPDM